MVNATSVGRRAQEARRPDLAHPPAAETLSFSWPVSFLQEVLRAQVTTAETYLVRVSAAPSVCYRLALAYADDGDPQAALERPQSVIIKRIAPLWVEDEEGHRREYSFYREVMPELALPSPHVYYTGPEPGSDYHLVILQDLATTHDFPTPRHRWTEGEFRLMLRAYARLHTRGAHWLRQSGGAPGWFYPRYETQVLAQAEQMPTMAETMVACGIWRPLPLLGRLVERTLYEIEQLAGEAPVILHNDPYPPNVGLPRDPVARHSGRARADDARTGGAEAVPIDWDMVGSGLAEMDLAYLFMQPYRSAAGIDRRAAETFYWQQHEQCGGDVPPPAERRLRQRHADSILALRQLPVAARMAITPYPAGSAPYKYWREMFAVLEERLRELCEELSGDKSTSREWENGRLLSDYR